MQKAKILEIALSFLLNQEEKTIPQCFLRFSQNSALEQDVQKRERYLIPSWEVGQQDSLVKS